MSEPAPDSSVPAAAPAPPPRRRPLFGRIMFLATLLLGLWLGYQEGPREIARWHLAAAMEHRLTARYELLQKRRYDAVKAQNLADEALTRALTWNSRDGGIYLERAKWREQDGDYEAALADCEMTGVTYDFYQRGIRKTSILTHLGRRQEAVDEALELLKMSQETGWPPPAIALNLVAYMRSLGKVDLPKGLQEIDESLKSMPGRDAARLDTRGFILYQLGRYEEAIKDFDSALPEVQQTIADLGASRAKRTRHSMDHRQLELDDQQALAELAVIYYHRALVLEKLNRWKEASTNHRKAKDLLGREPDESVF